MADEAREQTDQEARILSATQGAREAFSSSAADLAAERSAARAAGLSRYLGTQKLPHKKGTSSVSTREVTEAVEDLLPLILKPFVASDDVVAFDPQGPEDEAAAKQDADYVAHVLQTQCNGFFTLYEGAKDGLVSRKGVAHVDIAEDERTVVSSQTGVTEDQLQILLSDPNAEVIEGEAREQSVEVQPGVFETQTVYDLRVSITERERKPEITVIAPELFVIDDEHDSLNPDGAKLVGHWYKTTHGELIEDGFDEEKVTEALGGGNDSLGLDAGGEYTARHETSMSASLDDESPDAIADRELWVLCVRVLLDIDDSGQSRMVHAYISGGVVLGWEETDYNPYVQWSPFPVTHRSEGMSLDDMVGELQDVSTQLTRQLLNNVQGVNYGRPVVNESVKLTDLTGRQTGPIRVAGKTTVPQSAFMRDAPPVMVGELLTALGRVDQMREARSGYSKAMMGFDPSVMQQSTADAFARGMEQHNARTELMARIFGEMFVAGLYRKLHEVIRRHQDVPATVRLRGEWVTVDPREWAERKNVTVSVGIGYGTTDERMRQLGTVAAAQEKLFPAGLVKPEHMHATARRMIELAGFKNHGEFIANPQEMAMQQQQQQPDPAQIAQQMQMQLAQAQIQTEQAKAQAAVMRAQVEQQAKQRELDLRELEITLRAQGEQNKATAEAARLAQEERNRADRTAVELQQARSTVEAAELRVNGSLQETAMKLQNERLLKLPPEAFDRGDKAALDALAAEIDATLAEQQAQTDEFQRVAAEAFKSISERMNGGRKVEMQRDDTGELIGAMIDGRQLQFIRDANGDLVSAEYIEG